PASFDIRRSSSATCQDWPTSLRSSSIRACCWLEYTEGDRAAADYRWHRCVRRPGVRRPPCRAGGAARRRRARLPGLCDARIDGPAEGLHFTLTSAGRRISRGPTAPSPLLRAVQSRGLAKLRAALAKHKEESPPRVLAAAG